MKSIAKAVEMRVRVVLFCVFAAGLAVINPKKALDCVYEVLSGH